jgi:hypothetical protein
MTQHTPGPWIRTQGSGRFYIKTDTNFAQSLATVFSNKGDLGCKSSPDYEQAKANARLIAAAPDLLNALQELVSFAHEAGFPCDLAEIAIAKATGEKQ